MAEETPTETEAAEPAKKSGIAAMLPLVGGIAGGLVLGATLGFSLLGPKLAHKPTPAPVVADSAVTEPTAAKEGGSPKPGVAPSIYQLDNLVLNPAGSGGSHFLLMSVALEVKDAASLDVLKGRDAELRDGILRVLSRKTIEQATALQARDQFAVELKVLLGQMFGPGTISKIYFPQFVIQ